MDELELFNIKKRIQHKSLTRLWSNRLEPMRPIDRWNWSDNPTFCMLFTFFCKLVIFTTCVLCIVSIQLAGLLPCGLFRCHMYIPTDSGSYIGLGVCNPPICAAWRECQSKKKKKIKEKNIPKKEKEKEVGMTPTTPRCTGLVGWSPRSALQIIMNHVFI